MSRYRMSNGEYISKQMIDHKVWMAKKEKLQDMFDEFGFYFCESQDEVCGKDENCLPLDCAHLKSVDFCQKEGRAELAWDKKNLRILGRKCHRRLDKNGIISAKLK